MARWTMPANQSDKSKRNSFEGGINSSNPSIDIADNQSQDEYGWDTDLLPAIHSRKGRTPYGATGSSQTNLLANFGVTHLVRAVGTALQYDNAGTWTAIAGTFADVDWSATNFNGKLIMTNQTDNVKSWNGSALSDLNAVDAPKGKYVASNSLRVFIANTAANTDWIYYSKFLDETNWTDTSSSGFFQYYTTNGGSVTALREFGGVVLAFKADAMAEIVGTGQTTQKHRLLDISNRIGCVNFKTIAEVSTPRGAALFFLGQNDVYQFTAGQPTPIGEKIRRYLNLINTAQIGRCWAGTDGIRYFLGLVTVANTQPDTMLMYDPRYGTWRVNKINDNLRYSANINNVWYAGDATGQTYKMQQGQNDNGTAIAWSLTTKDFDEGSPELEKEYWELHLQMLAPTGTTFTLQVSTDQGTTYTQIGDPITAQGIYQDIPVIVPLDTVPISHWTRFKLSGTGEVTINSMQRFYRLHPFQI